MAKYSIYDAKNNLSKLLQKAAAGEEVIIVNRDEPVAEIVPIRPKKRKLGGLRSKIKFNAGWDAPLDDFEDYTR